MTATNGLVDELIDQLSVKTVFTIPIFGGIKIAESVVVMWIIMAIVIVASIFLTRKLSVENPGKRQLFLEVCIGKFYGFDVDKEALETVRFRGVLFFTKEVIVYKKEQGLRV